MSGTHTVSIIVVNFNGMPHIDTCLSSLTKQDASDYEIIFVDNASTDGSLEYTRKTFPGLIFVTNDSNLGYAGGINSGLAHATGRYIAPINIDTEVAPTWLSSMVDFLASQPLAAAVTPKILLFHQRDRINAKGLNIHISGLGFCRYLSRKDDGSVTPERVSGISGCSYLIRREALERIGGAPEEYFMGNDDVIISWLLNLAGYEVYCIPSSVVFHKYSLKMDPDKLSRLERGRQTLLLASLKPLTLILLSPIFGAIECMIIAYSLMKGKAYAKAKLDAYLSLWHERKTVQQKRKQYQQIRAISDFALLRRLNWNLEWSQLWQILS